MRTVIVFLVYLVIIIFFIPFLLVCYIIRTPESIIHVGKWAIRVGKGILGIHIDIQGLDRVDKNAPYIFMANHLSFLDGPLLFMQIPQPVRVILKKEIFRIPVVGLGMKQVGFVPVDRKGIRGGKKSIESAIKMIQEEGYSFLIFPEGTRSRDGNLQPFKRGGFFLAVNSLTPILPVVIKGTYELMPKGKKIVKKGRISISFLPPISTEGFDRGSLPSLIEKVKKAIHSELTILEEASSTPERQSLRDRTSSRT